MDTSWRYVKWYLRCSVSFLQIRDNGLSNPPSLSLKGLGHGTEQANKKVGE